MLTPIGLLFMIGSGVLWKRQLSHICSRTIWPATCIPLFFLFLQKKYSEYYQSWYKYFSGTVNLNKGDRLFFLEFDCNNRMVFLKLDDEMKEIRFIDWEPVLPTYWSPQPSYQFSVISDLPRIKFKIWGVSQEEINPLCNLNCHP